MCIGQILSGQNLWKKNFLRPTWNGLSWTCPDLRRKLSITAAGQMKYCCSSCFSSLGIIIMFCKIVKLARCLFRAPSSSPPKLSPVLQVHWQVYKFSRLLPEHFLHLLPAYYSGQSWQQNTSNLSSGLRRGGGVTGIFMSVFRSSLPMSRVTVDSEVRTFFFVH